MSSLISQIKGAVYAYKYAKRRIKTAKDVQRVVKTIKANPTPYITASKGVAKYALKGASYSLKQTAAIPSVITKFKKRG